MTPEELFKRATKSEFAFLFEMSMGFGMISNYSLNSKSVQELIHRDDLEFDLVINEEFFHDAFLMFGHKFKAPTITLSAFGHADYFDRQMGLLTPLSHVPHVFLSYGEKMSFSERWYNTIFSIYDYLLRHFIHLPTQNKMAKQHFGHLRELPTIEDMLKNVSLILVNTHRSIQPPRPAMPGIINIGGAHVKEPKPLPNDIQTFLDGAKDGVIYFSFGTVLKSSKMPKDKLYAFLGKNKLFVSFYDF